MAGAPGQRLFRGDSASSGGHLLQLQLFLYLFGEAVSASRGGACASKGRLILCAVLGSGQ